jgi:hypothetical protein
LDEFEAKLEAEGSFLMPARGNDTMPDKNMPDMRSWIHREYASLDGEHSAEWHQCQYWDAAVTKVERKSFYVTDRGTADESARWEGGKNPRPDPSDPTITQQFEAWLQSKINDGTIRHYSNVSANSATETGTCTVVINLSGKAVEKRVIVEKTAEGVQYEAME